MSNEKSDEFAARVSAAASKFAAEVCKRGYTDEQSATLAFIEGASFAVVDVRREIRGEPVAEGGLTAPADSTEQTK